MKNLRWASFNHNNLYDLSLLVRYEKLEELCLEDNQIISFDVLSKLENLSKLDLSYNRISSLENAADFRNLTQLSLQGNGMTDLKFLAKLPNLSELCTCVAPSTFERCHQNIWKIASLFSSLNWYRNFSFSAKLSLR